MDPQTLHHYSVHAPDIAQRYESAPSPLATKFTFAFPAGGRILDIGCGSGRDLAELGRQGFQPHGVDGTPELVELAQQLHPELSGRIVHGVLPDLAVPFDGGFDGVLCSAVLMHLDASAIFNAALSIKRCLRVHGRLLISVPVQRPDVGAGDRDANGRLFKTYPPGYLQLIFERLGFGLIEQWFNTDSQDRQGIQWVSLLFVLNSGANTRPIDQIEGVLNHDKKSATYKFALIRALADIATQSPQAVTWLADGRVGLPVGHIAERWLQYYWPLVESGTFIPQLNGERPDGGKPIKFRQRLRGLVEHYARLGGYSAFRIARNKGQLSATVQVTLRAVMADIEHAIIQGPVVHAGGALQTGRVFGFDARLRQVLMPNDLWVELSHLGYWVSQAVVLQWAEKTSRLGPNIDVAMVVNLLLDKEDERSTTEARQVFAAMGQLECVWSGVTLRQRFEVDHVIPFDLWHNNDTWNLLPASRTCNQQKSNKLPSAEMLRARKDCIVGYWERLRGHDAQRFDKEAETLLSWPTEDWKTRFMGSCAMRSRSRLCSVGWGGGLHRRDGQDLGWCWAIVTTIKD